MPALPSQEETEEDEQEEAARFHTAGVEKADGRCIAGRSDDLPGGIGFHQQVTAGCDGTGGKPFRGH